MKNVLEAPFLREMMHITANMYRLGYDERNGGNVSLLLDEAEVAGYLDTGCPIRTISFAFDAKALAGRIFLVTGTGKYFKNIERDPANNLGILRIRADGTSADLLWGYEDGGRPTSEFPAHLMSHMARLAVNPDNRVVMHCHPNNLLAMTYVHEQTTEAFTHTLWQMNTESIVVFPDGVEVLPWMVCGTKEIGEATAEKMKSARTVVWCHHGLYGAGKDLDEAFGLIETVEKAAQIYMMTAHLPKVSVITDAQLQALCDAFHIMPRAGILK